MVECTLWLEFGLPLETKHSYLFSLTEESFDRFINEISDKFKIDSEEEFDEVYEATRKKYYVSNSLFRSYLGSKYIKENRSVNE